MKVELIDHMGNDLTVVNAARVSLAKHKDEFDKDDGRLLMYLARNHHWTPFAHPQVQFRIEAPIFVTRQLFRHNVGLVINEESRRYVDDEPTFYQIDQFRARPEKSIKQGSGSDVTAEVNAYALDIVEGLQVHALSIYNTLLSLGIAPEQARIVLPMSTNTHFYWTGSLYAIARMCQQRLDSHAQKEIRDLAMMISNHMSVLFPYSWAALVTDWK